MSTSRKSQILDFLQSDPRSPFLLFALAKEFENENNTRQAIDTYEQLLLHHPNYTGAYYHLGKQYILEGDVVAAQSVFNRGLLICIQQKATHDASELRTALDDLE